MTGGAEAMIKLMKEQMRILRIQEGDRKLSALEYETLFSRISSIVNERPLTLGGEQFSPQTISCLDTTKHYWTTKAHKKPH